MSIRKRLDRLEKLRGASRPPADGRDDRTDAEIEQRIAFLDSRAALALGITAEELHDRRLERAARIPPERRGIHRGRPPQSLTDEELEEAIADLEASRAAAPAGGQGG